MTPLKVLIIKLGYSETFHPRIGEDPSLGDIFMTTMILHPFKDHHVTWLVDRMGIPLLDGITHIDSILPYDITSVLQLQSEVFDTIINLEKVPGVCALADSIKARVKYGYYFDVWLGQARSRNLLLNSYLSLEAKMVDADRFWPEVLFDVINRKWDGEKCILNHIPKSAVEFDVGLNYKVGPKWPNKAWLNSSFISLECGLRDLGYRVSWQKGDTIKEYVDWIGRCRLLVTSDSLGLHLAVALGKRVVAIVGSTTVDDRYIEGSVIRPKNYACAPCWESGCEKETPCLEDFPCMRDIKVEDVLMEVKKWLE